MVLFWYFYMSRFSSSFRNIRILNNFWKHKAEIQNSKEDVKPNTDVRGAIIK